MTHDIDRPDALPLLRAFFDGRDLDGKCTLAAYVITVDGDGWPHSAMISAGELLISERDARLALWARSRSTANLIAGGRLVLVVVLDGAAVRARFEFRKVDGDETLTYFLGSLVDADADTAPYADLVSGVRFALLDPPAAIDRWRETLRRLAAL
jgi:hypothetical protein